MRIFVILLESTVAGYVWGWMRFGDVINSGLAGPRNCDELEWDAERFFVDRSLNDAGSAGSVVHCRRRY